MKDSAPSNTSDAIKLFDSLKPADTTSMLGKWVGQEFPTDHPMDGLLGASYWHGKRFEGDDAVHPMVHHFPLWGEMSINPGLLPIRFLTILPFRDSIIKIIFPLVAPLVSTRKPKARLRSLEFRGRMHAAMCYDNKPINDVFAVIDQNTVLGWMDFKGTDQPYFFTLTRKD